MAERLDLTPAEILARQRLQEEALARRNADAELFSRMDQPRPEEQPARPDVVRGIPEAAERGFIFETLSQLAPFERDVIRQPQSTFETIQRYNPGGLDGEAFVEEDVRTSYTPGEYGPRRFAPPPIVDAISGGLKFGDRLLFGDDKEQAEARETVRQGIGALPGVPKAIVESVVGGAENVARGNITTRDAEGNITRPGQFAEALAMFPAARLLTDVPENSFGIFGGKKGKSGDEAEDIVAMLEESGLDAKEGWERQSGSNTYKSYRSSLDGKVRYEIPMQNASFKGIVREVEDPDVELGKILAGGPEAAEQRLLNMQAMRIRKINDKDYLTVPGFFELNEDVLNQYGFTKYDHKTGKKGLIQFPEPTLEQVVDFPELFNEYPQLRNIRIKPTPPLALFVKGSYNPDTKEISLASVPNTPEGRKEMMSTLMHEIQHAVQDIEGTYGGANPGMFEPFDFQNRRKKNQDSLTQQEKLLEDDLAEVGIDDSGSKLNQNKFLKIFSKKQEPGAPKPLIKALSDEQFRDVRFRVLGYVKNRAQEVTERSEGKVSKVDEARNQLEKDIFERQEYMRQRNEIARERDQSPFYTEEQINAVDGEYRNQAFRYSGSDRDLIRLNESLKQMGLPNSENLTERLSKAFEERIPALQPLLKERNELDEISSRSYQMYAGNPGEVEARHSQLRFEGIKKDRYYTTEDGKQERAKRDYTAEETIELFPEQTQQMVLPEQGLVYSLSEGKKTLTPGERLSMSMDPDDPQMELPGMGGDGGGRKPPTMDDPAQRFLAKRDGIRGSLDTDTEMTAPISPSLA